MWGITGGWWWSPLTSRCVAGVHGLMYVQCRGHEEKATGHGLVSSSGGMEGRKQGACQCHQRMQHVCCAAMAAGWARALVTALTPGGSHWKLCIANSHTEGTRGAFHLQAKEGHELDVIRLRQVRQLLAGIAGDLHLPQGTGAQAAQSAAEAAHGNGNGNGVGVQHAHNGNGNGNGNGGGAAYVPVIITGDFNTTPGSLPCKVRSCKRVGMLMPQAGSTLLLPGLSLSDIARWLLCR